MRWLLAAALSAAVFISVSAGTLVALQEPAGITFLFAAPPLRGVLVAWSISVVAVVLLFTVVNRRAARIGEEAHARTRSGAWLAPLAGLAVTALGVIPALPGASPSFSVFAYVFHDLRWWWLAGLALWTAVRVRGGLPRTPRSFTRPFIGSIGIFFVVTVAAVVMTPYLRFTGGLHGDEPKYIRYDEVWIQGGGLAIDEKTPYARDADRRVPALLTTAAGFAAATIEEGRSFARDVAAFVRSPTTFRWLRASGADGFVTGKHGGIYQIHNPGVSAIVFPGYAIDRLLVRGAPGPTGEFPTQLPFTNGVMLVVYGLSAVAMLKLLRAALRAPGNEDIGSRDAAWPWIWTAIALLTLPTSAFAFKLYPELPALLAIATVVHVLGFRADDIGGGTAALSGLAAAATIWLHPRFLLVAAVLAGFALLQLRGRQRLVFLTAFAAVVGSVLAFEYRVTGSFSPSARWAAIAGGPTFDAPSVPLNLIGYAVDRTWGVIPHAPVLLLALPGFILLCRSNPIHGLLLIALMGALVIPAAGHSLSAAGGTPGRLVLAVVPLAFWPIAVASRRAWHSMRARAVVVVLTVLSLDAAISYNLHHLKHFGPLRAPGTGWRPNLLFPEMRGDDWTAPTNLLLLGVSVVWIVLVTMVVLRAARPHDSRNAASSHFARALTAVVAAIVLIAVTAGRVSGLDTDYDYRPQATAAIRTAAGGLLRAESCAICFTSRDGAIDWTRLRPNAADSVAADVEVEGSRARIIVRVGSDPSAPHFGRIRLEFGDESSSPWTPVVEERTIEHDYPGRGTYTLTVRLRVADGGLRQVERQIEVK